MKIAVRIGLALVATLVIAAAAGYVWLRQSLPQTSGTLAVAGLAAPVEVIRDANDIPHIYATSIADAHFALGYVHAQDRLWQMEMNRRVAAARLSEVFGAASLDTDRFLRTLGVYRAAEATIPRFDAATRAALDAYSAGVNAFLATRSGPLPPEFLAFGVVPEPWKPADSVAWLKMMAWDLGGNWATEILRLRLAQRLDSRQIAEFLPPYPGDTPLPVRDLAELYRGLAPAAATIVAVAPPSLPEGAGSNNWVIAGSRSVSGKPLLANDPHLGLNVPAIWYFAHLSAPGLDAIGATLPGSPMLVLGRNDRIAWGFTNTGPDVQDLYIEKIDGADPTRYATPDGTQAFAVRTETIRVKGAPDETLVVRSTRHGPVISDVSRVAGAGDAQGVCDRDAMDGVARRRHDRRGGRDDAARRELERIPRRRAAFPFAAAEHGVRRRRRQHRVRRRGARSDPARRQRSLRHGAGARLGRALRLAGLHSLRRIAARIQPPCRARS